MRIEHYTYCTHQQQQQQRHTRQIANFTLQHRHMSIMQPTLCLHYMCMYVKVHLLECVCACVRVSARRMHASMHLLGHMHLLIILNAFACRIRLPYRAK